MSIATSEIAEPSAPAESQSPPEPAKPVCAVLVIEGCKMKQAKVTGKSGAKYTFKFSDRYKGPVREYASALEFEREERDMRLARRSQFVLTTRFTPAHPVIHAKEALQNLIGAVRQVPLEARKDALYELGDTIEEALFAIDLQQANPSPDPEPAAASAEQPASPADVAVPLKESRWTTEEGFPAGNETAPAAPPEVAASEPPPSPVLPGQKTQEELMTMLLPELRSLLEAAGLRPGNDGRKTLVARYLKAQADGFPKRKEGGAE